MSTTIRRRDLLMSTPIALPFAASGSPDGGRATRDFGIIKNQSSPHAALRGVDLASVRWTEGFWAQRYRQTHEVTLRKLWDLLADPEAGHVLSNMRIAGGLETGDYAGTNWQDAWLYKWIEAGSCIYRTTGDKWIEERMNQGIDLIARAQQKDGYVATQITARNKPRWRDPREHEAYVMGHLLTAGCIHHRMTGERSLLDIAIRTGDFLCETLGVTVNPSFAHNPTAVMGLVELYRETGQQRYLEGAQRIVDGRGRHPKPGGVFYKGPGVLGTDLFQDRVPFRKGGEVVGHNVFFTYLFAGAADIYMETGDKTLEEPLDRYWKDLTQHKMCINGGVSPMGHGLSSHNDPVVEAVGKPYYLPSADSYNETCGQIGNMMWNYRLLSIKPEVRYADLMELEMYNGFLGGIGLDGESWFYRNALRRYDTEHKSLGHNDLVERGLPGRKRICCPSNLLRTLAQMENYFYSVSEDGLWVHHYGGNRLDTRLPDGSRIAVTQRTGYPWDGGVTLTIDEVERAGEFSLRLRVPQWAAGSTATLNGRALADQPTAGEYFAIHRAWKPGDVIALNLPMKARIIEAHPKAEQLRNQVAVMRGPVLYCLESPDMPEDVNLDNVYLPSDITFEPVPTTDLPFGIVALKGQALYRSEPAWSGDLYRRLEQRPLKPIPVRLVPYFAWNNRGPSTMSVWLPLILKS
ncbi:MAG: glycoside hydrolase family 127 protein [bacterium]|nr:glycoside hydrolase family 127 protein [bacterium]